MVYLSIYPIKQVSKHDGDQSRDGQTESLLSLMNFFQLRRRPAVCSTGHLGHPRRLAFRKAADGGCRQPCAVGRRHLRDGPHVHLYARAGGEASLSSARVCPEGTGVACLTDHIQRPPIPAENILHKNHGVAVCASHTVCNVDIRIPPHLVLSFMPKIISKK